MLSDGHTSRPFLSAVCGVRAKTCQRGVTTGEGLSPKKKGYRFTGLQRNTGVAIDGSGNVWVANNWEETVAS